MKKILSLAIGLLLAMTVQAQNELYVYQHSGVTDTLQLADVTGISHSRTDLDGRVCDDYVVMSVSTGQDGIRRYLLAALDSVVMQRDGRRIRLTRFVGYQDGRGGSGLLKSRGRAKTSLDGDFMADSGEIVDFYWSDDDNIFIYSEDDERMYAADSVDYHEPDKAVADFFFKTAGITGDEISVYYLGQGSPNTSDKHVLVKADQTQAEPNNSQHIGTSGDCGTAIATKPEGQDHYRFELEHQAAYLCFLPYIGNDLGRTVLRKVTVRSNGAIAGEYTLSPDDGMVLHSNASHTVTLTTGGEDGFLLPQRPSQSTSAFMVIAPQPSATRLTCEFTVYDTQLQSEGVFTKTVDLETVEANKVYVIRANCNNYVVDLGLPVKFLNHNYGAFAPEEYGGYYAYGELTDKGNYTSSNYTYQNTTVGPEIRLTDKDVAHVMLGGNFSMPTAAEMRMLTDSLDAGKWLWTAVNGHSGYLLTGKNGNHLFLPAASYRYGTSYGTGTDGPNYRGTYRTSTLQHSTIMKNWYLNFNSTGHSVALSGNDIYYGESIRPVVSSGVTTTDGTVIQVMTDSARWQPKLQTATLYGTLSGYDAAPSKSAVEIGFLVGNLAQVSAGNGTPVVAAVAADGRYSAPFALPKDTVYYYRAYAKDADGHVSYANTLQFGRAYVDLGLPSGNLWANVNIGASSPEEAGGYYAWGETQEKNISYIFQNYRWNDQANGYTWFEPQGQRNIQATRYDVAVKNWGETWMAPDEDDLRELWNNTTHTPANLYGVEGWLFENNGNSIFLPKAGYKTTGLNDYGSNGFMLSSELAYGANSHSDYAFRIYTGNFDGSFYRSDGYSARAVSKTNASTADGHRLYAMAMPARRYYDGQVERDTLRGAVLGWEHAGNTTTCGFVYWKAGQERGSIAPVAVTPDADGQLAYVLTGLDEGTTYYYQVYVDNGSQTFYSGNSQLLTTVGVVDLGLSVKWANVNIGAENEFAVGNYYRWGASVPYRNTQQQYGVDENLSPAGGHDTATNLWGGDYRMPSMAEFDDLRNNCTMAFTEEQGMKGFRFTSNVAGYEGNSIFLPAGGWYEANNTYVNSYNSSNQYWTATSTGVGTAYDLNYNEGSPYSDGLASQTKAYGFPVRAVQGTDQTHEAWGISRNTRDAVEVDTLVGFFGLRAGNAIEAGFILGLTDNPKVGDDGVQVLKLSSPVSGVNKYAVSGLDAAHVYYFRTYVRVAGEYQYSAVVKSFQPMQLIDLGLPSGTLWANINTGADVVEGFGDHYAWGETTTKDNYNQNTYQFYQNGSYVEIGDDIGGTQYDAATVHMGQLWRMPTMAQCSELVLNTTATPVTVNGVNCWKLTSKVAGYTDRYIIFPRNSQMKNSTFAGDNNNSGVYTTSTRHSNYQAKNMYMPASGPSANPGSNFDEKYWGKNIRPVAQKNADLGDGKFAHVGTDGCDWTIGAATATLKGHVALSAAVEGATCGFIVGAIKEVDTTEPADANVVTAVTMTTGTDFTYDYPYEGGARYFRTFLKVGGRYYFGPVKAVGPATMLDVEFNVAGEAFDGSYSRLPVTKTGSATTPYNDTYKRYETDLSGNPVAGTNKVFYQFAYEYFDEFARQLSESHSIEALIMPRALSYSESDIIANYESGGEGIGIYREKFYYCADMNGYQYFYTGMTPTVGQYYHLVMTWDKENRVVRMYVNGVKESETTDVPQNYSSPTFRFLTVGGQPDRDGGVSESWNGNISFIRIYDRSLTGDEVNTLFVGINK